MARERVMSFAEQSPPMSEQGGTSEDDAGPGGSSAAEADQTESGGRPCPICEEPMYSRHCKYVCPQHGVVYDCSDTFY
jgi:hypothetical protein